ncbi:hypothetical protein [Treponema pectinovorum]|uniref:hypothetical protein n=1 Tax=Treponema pectinovorum TaxID=164 RepID=UPI0011F33ECC|nr:hypothetical protein [Treponema pectinovorum]
MNFPFFMISIIFSIISFAMIFILILTKPWKDWMHTMLIIGCLFIATISFSFIKTRILYEKTQNYIVQENKDTSIPYEYKIQEITVKEYRDKSWITNDWKEDSQQFKKEEKITYSNELPNEKYTFIEEQGK